MNHKWKKTEDKQKCVCVNCKAERLIAFAFVIYSRSGIVFNYRPDCIDWELENSKTID